jgi:hypothetical protein
MWANQTDSSAQEGNDVGRPPVAANTVTGNLGFRSKFHAGVRQ